MMPMRRTEEGDGRHLVLTDYRRRINHLRRNGKNLAYALDIASRVSTYNVASNRAVPKCISTYNLPYPTTGWPIARFRYFRASVFIDTLQGLSTHLRLFRGEILRAHLPKFCAMITQNTELRRNVRNALAKCQYYVYLFYSWPRTHTTYVRTYRYCSRWFFR